MSLRLSIGKMRKTIASVIPTYTQHTAAGSVVIPAGVTSIHVGGVGSAGTGIAYSQSSGEQDVAIARSGGGGGAAYKNNIAVTPGETLQIVTNGTLCGLYRGPTALFLAYHGTNATTSAAGTGGPATSTASVAGIVSFAGSNGINAGQVFSATANGAGCASFTANGVTSSTNGRGGRGLNIRTGATTGESATLNGTSPGGSGAANYVSGGSVGLPGGWLIRIFYKPGNTFPSNVDFA